MALYVNAGQEQADRSDKVDAAMLLFFAAAPEGQGRVSRVRLLEQAV